LVEKKHVINGNKINQKEKISISGKWNFRIGFIEKKATGIIISIKFVLNKM